MSRVVSGSARIPASSTVTVALPPDAMTVGSIVTLSIATPLWTVIVRGIVCVPNVAVTTACPVAARTLVGWGWSRCTRPVDLDVLRDRVVHGVRGIGGRRGLGQLN